MSNINLLYILEGGRPSGAENNMLTVIRAIDKSQFKVNVCLLGPSPILESEFKHLGIPFYILNTKGKYDLTAYIKLIRLIQREKISIVHTILYTSNTFGRIAALLAGVPVIIGWEHGEIFEPTPVGHYRIDWILAKITDCVVTPSKATKEELIKKEGIPAYKIRVIYNGIDLAEFNGSSSNALTRKQLGIEADEILIGSVANFEERKRHKYIITAMPKIIKVCPKIKLLLVGEGPLRQYISEMVDNLGIKDKVIFAGFRIDISVIMNAIDIYVCSSDREAFGLAVLEAMALKKPVVSTNVCGMPEMVIDGQTGYLVPPHDVDSIAEAVISLLANKEKMRQMGEAGFERIKTCFSSEILAKEIEALYKELLWKKHPKFQS